MERTSDKLILLIIGWNGMEKMLDYKEQNKVKCLINGLFRSFRISNQIQYLIFIMSSKSTPCQVV